MFSCYVQQQVAIIFHSPKLSAGCNPVRSSLLDRIQQRTIAHFFSIARPGIELSLQALVARTQPTLLLDS